MRLTDDLYAFVWEGYENNCNSFFLGGSVGALIDPGHLRFADSLLDRMSVDGISLGDIRLVIVTHSHPDHMEAVPRFTEQGVPVAMHPAALEYLDQIGAAMYQWMGSDLPGIDGVIPIEEGPVGALDGLVSVYHTPGHEPGSLCVHWPERKALATGDLVFSGSVGRTDFPGGDHARLMAEVDRMSRLEVEHLLPGHGPVLQSEAAIARNYADMRAVFG
ncbi:MAG: MBL fold metallo-hydrolase [Armatimonadetes bacterium]|nr:MBL fold metallo-hydrolase [Armatimonadota bacterium]